MKPEWKDKGAKSAQVMTGSCVETKTTTVVCDATTLGVEARVVNTRGVELKPLLNINETGAVQGRTATLDAGGTTLTVTGDTGCGADKLVTMTVTSYVCE